MKQKIVNLCYEEWAILMLRKSIKDDLSIQEEIIEKMESLRNEILIKGGNVSSIDYTRVAKIAQERGKEQIAISLLEYEKSVIKKIPFLLQLN